MWTKLMIASSYYLISNLSIIIIIIIKKVLRRERKMLRDGEEAMSIGKSFQTEAPATGKVRLPMVESTKRNEQSVRRRRT
jgi:hypothetical protein